MGAELLTVDNLPNLGFKQSEQSEVEVKEGVVTFEHRQISVTLIKGREDYPEVTVFLEDQIGSINFPGVFTLEDVRDLKHFLYPDE